MKTFKQVKIGEEFRFESEKSFPFSGMEKGPWIKVSARCYQKPDPRFRNGFMQCRVGSINAQVLP